MGRPKSSNNLLCEIPKGTMVKIYSSRKVAVSFCGETPYTGFFTYQQAVLGNIKDPTERSFLSLGYAGGHFFGKICPYTGENIRKRWSGILERVTKKRRGYESSSVGEDWEDFQQFASWWKKEIKAGRYSGDCAVDKDLLSEGIPCYTSSKCLLLPRGLNNLIAAAMGFLSGKYNLFTRDSSGNYIAKSCNSYAGYYKNKNMAIKASLGEMVREIERYAYFPLPREGRLKLDKIVGELNEYRNRH